MLGFIGRLDYQKGVDLIRDTYGFFMEQNCQLIMLGSGREDLENNLRYGVVFFLYVVCVYVFCVYVFCVCMYVNSQVYVLPVYVRTVYKIHTLSFFPLPQGNGVMEQGQVPRMGGVQCQDGTPHHCGVRHVAHAIPV